MDSVVLDASVILAFMRSEPGIEMLTPAFLRRSVMSSVNLAEVQTSLVLRGVEADVAWRDANSLIASIEPFTAEQAGLAGTLAAQTRSLGLSLGDRACLALAIILDAPVYTTDRAWKTLKVGCRIHVIR